MKGKTKVLILLVIAVVLVGGIYVSPNNAEQSKGFPSLKASAPATKQIAVTKPGVTGPQKTTSKPTASVGAYSLSTTNKKPEKVQGFKPHLSMQAHKSGKQGGDNCGSATVIPNLPYADNGTTVGYTNDYDEVCPYSGSTSPDVVYSFAPATNKVVNIDLWGSSYDTKLYVYQGTCDNAHLVACNDDYYSNYVSAIMNQPLSGGSTYYIVIDGYGGGSGDYVLNVTEVQPCNVVCPPEGIPEGETPCADEYVDTYNGGCNSSPYVFQTINCNTTICGTSGTYLYTGLQYRDTDWFRVVITSPTTLNWSAVAEFPVLLFVMNAGTENCSDYTVLGSITANPCDTATLTFDVQPGVYWLWVGPSVFTGYPCPLDYVAKLTCVVATTGACCNTAEPYDCQVLTPVDCAALPGHTFKGLGTSCGPPNPCLPAPPNDECTGAIVVNAPVCPNVITVNGSTVGANIDCPGVLDWQAVWYRFDLPYASNKLSIDYCPTVTPINTFGIVIYNSCPADCPNYILASGYQFVGCPNGNTGPQAWWNGLPAGTYYLPVYVVDYNGSPYMDFTFDACIEQQLPPANDNCENATPVGNVTNLAFSTSSATFDGPGSCQTAPNVWYCYTATCNGNAHVALCGSSYDTKLAVYDGCSCPPTTLLGCNDDGCGGYLQSDLSIPVVMGQTYLIEVGGYSTATGDGYLSIGCSLPPPNDECTGAPVINTFPSEVSGTTIGASVDCPNDLGWNAVWYEFQLPYACNNLTVNYCPTNYGPTTFGIVVYNSCPPDCPNYILASGYDWPSCPNGNTNAEIFWYNLPPGNYWFPVYLGGEYDFTFDVSVDSCVPCVVTCPPGAMAEGEPDCYDNYEDTYNGGCNSSTYIFEDITCNTTVCGTSGTYLYYGGQYRDTDWYRVQVGDGTLTWKVVAEFPVLIFLIDAGTENCADYTVLNSIIANPCDTAVLSQYVPAGVYWLWVGPSVFAGVNCGSKYVGRIECTGLGPQISVNPTSISKTLPPGATTDVTLVISNTGSENLDYEIDYNLSNTWLGVAPRFGTILPAGSDNINIHLDASVVGLGTYNDVLLIASNSASKQLDDTVQVPVQLTVAYPPDIDVPSQLSVGVLPGCNIEKPLKVSNTGLGPLNFEAHVSGNPPLKVGISQRPIQERTKGNNSGPLMAGKLALDTSNPARLSLGGHASPGTPLRAGGDTLFVQMPRTPDNPDWSFATSDAGAGYKVEEDIWGLSEQITGIQWWGLCLIYSGGWSNGTPENLAFNITFYSDPIGTMPPTNVVSTYTNVVPTVVHTGLFFAGIYEEILFSYDLPTPCNLPSGYGWVAVQSQSAGQGYDWFLWASAETGDGYSYQDGSGEYMYDDALILVGGSGCPFTVAPNTGTVAGGGSTELILTFDGSVFTQCADETLSCYVVITSNDPDEPTVSTKVDFWSGRGDVFQPLCFIDIGDVVYLVNYVLKNGPAPSPLCMGDCDPSHDGVVDLADIVYLTQYLFLKGAPPQVSPATQISPIQR